MNIQPYEDGNCKMKHTKKRKGHGLPKGMAALTNFLLYNKNQSPLFPSKLSALSPLKTNFAPFFCFPL